MVARRSRRLLKPAALALLLGGAVVLFAAVPIPVETMAGTLGEVQVRGRTAAE